MAKTPTWQRAAGKNPEGGLNEAGRRSLRAAGHDIKRPQPEGGSRKKSFCARMKGMKAKLTSSETANDPNSRINKSLRKWKCADGGEVTVENALRLTRKGDKIPLRPYEPRWNESTGKFDSPQNKGIGFAGPLKQRGADHVVSEYSRDEDFQYPTIHSGMSAADRAAVMEAERLSGPKYQGNDIISERLNRAQKPFDIPQDVDRRAYEAAKERIQAGRSPFFEQGRDPYPAWSPEQYWEEPAVMPNRADPLMYADGGEVTVDNALRMARGRPDEGGQERFLREQLAGSAPQYEPSQDFPARAERAVQAADRYAGVLNDLAARGAGLPKEFQSPQGRSAREIVESALPQDPNAIVKQAMRQAGEGNRLAAAETMLGGIPETGAIRAYHGSPHRFDRFDISKIGTGEGAQAYGHGLYFAENPKVAEGYRDSTSQGTLIDPQGRVFSPMNELEHLNVRVAADRYGVDAALARARQLMEQGGQDRPHRTQQALESDYNKLLALKEANVVQNPGHMYEVEIAAEPHQLLDWDKPLSEQPEAVRKSIYDLYKVKGYTGENVPLSDVMKQYAQSGIDPQKAAEPYFRSGAYGAYTDLGQQYGSQAAASQKLREAGIPGIQYLDAGSRSAGEGSRNFVIFDPSLIDIKRRYADGGDVTVDNALRMARNMGGGTLYNQLNYAINSPTPANPPQDPGPQQPYYQSLPQTRDIIQQYGTPAPGAPTSTPVRQPMPYAKGGKAIWNKPRPKSLGKSEPLSPAQKASAKAAAKAAGRPYPNMVDNIRAARKADGGQVEGDVQFAPNDLPMMARQPDVEIENALRMARETQPKKEYAPFGVLPLREDEAGIHFDPYAGVLGSVTRPFKYFTETMSGQKPMDVTSPEAISAAADIAGATTLGAGAFERPAGALAAGASRPAEQAMREAYQRALNSTGLYSHAAEAAYNLPQAKGSYEQMIAMLQKAGVKPEELYWSGVEKAFKGQPRVTREQLVQHFEQGVPKIEETVFGGPRDENLSKSFSVVPVGHGEFEVVNEAGIGITRYGSREMAEETAQRFNTEGLPSHLSGRGQIMAEPKFQQYTIPGGENYREVLLSTPGQKRDLYKQISQAREDRIAAVKEHGSVLKYDDPALEQERLQKIREATKRENDLRVKLENIPPEYQSSHWDQPNVLGHLRMSDRTGPEGEKILHLEELQSDWGQQGREKGFGKYTELPSDRKVIESKNARGEPVFHVEGPEGKTETAREYSMQNAINSWINNHQGVPSAPYVESTKNWVDLGLKRALKEAAEGGYSKMVWTPGEEQAARYELSKQVDSLLYKKNPDGTYWLNAQIPQRGGVILGESLSEKQLEDHVGKEVADRIINGQGKKTEIQGKYDPVSMTSSKDYAHQLSGEGLQVGGEGMKGFYGKIVPSRLKELLKKIDPQAKMSFTEIQTPDGPMKVPTLEITPKIREAVKRGLPAYADGGEVVN